MQQTTHARKGRRRVCIAGSLVASMLACMGVPSPQPVQRLPTGQLVYIERGHGSTPNRPMRIQSGLPPAPLDWGLTLGTSWGASDQIVPLDGGAFVYCGTAQWQGQEHQHCWRIPAPTEDREIEILGPPHMDLPPKIPTVLPPWFAPGGAWWTGRDSIEWAPALEAPPQTVKLEEPIASPAIFDPVHQRFAGEFHNRKSGCEMAVFDLDGAITHRHTMGDWCDTPMWRPDGSSIAVATRKGIELWTPGVGLTTIAPRQNGPDGAEEELVLLTWSPDGQHLLVRSSRNHAQQYNWCAGVSVAHRAPYTVEVASGLWSPAPDPGLTAAWIR